MEVQLKTLCILLALVAIVSGARRRQGCTINPNNKNAFPKPQPLLLQMKSVPTLASSDKGGNIVLDHQERLTIACSGSGNYFANVSGKFEELEIFCQPRNKFFVPKVGKVFSFEKLNCLHLPKSEARTDDKRQCGPNLNNTLINVGFSAAGTFLALYEVCFDESEYRTLYSRVSMTPSIKGFQKGFPRPSGFSSDDRFHGIPPLSNLYKRSTQVKTFSRILQSDSLAMNYIRQKGNHFLSRGHLVAKADMIFGSEQTATFRYINTVPQWQTLNGNNWGDIESDTRLFIIKRKRNLVVYTGALERSYLTDVNGVRKDLFLFSNDDSAQGNKIPIPRYIYKILYDPETGEGVTFLGWNNPHVEPEEEPCQDRCSELNWISWLDDRNNSEAGICFCCAVPDVQRRWAEVPREIRVTKLLN